MNFTDSFDSFLEWYSGSLNKSDAVIISYFKNVTIINDPIFYNFRKNIYDDKGKNFDLEILKVYKEFGIIKKKFIKIHKDLQKNIEEAIKILKITYQNLIVKSLFMYAIRLVCGMVAYNWLIMIC